METKTLYFLVVLLALATFPFESQSLGGFTQVQPAGKRSFHGKKSITVRLIIITIIALPGV